MFSHHLDGFVVFPDLGEVFLVIARRVEDLLNAAIAFLVIDETQQDGDVGTLGDQVEASFPMVDLLAGAFRTDDEMGVLVLAEHVDHLFHEMVLLATIYADGAKFVECPAHEAGLEELRLDHELEFGAVVPIEAHTHEKVGDGGVRRHNAYGIAKIGGDFIHCLPPADLEADFSNGSFDAHYQIAALSSGAIYILFSGLMSKAS